jgi:hypothetical protein
MTKQLSQLFDLPTFDETEASSSLSIDETHAEISELDEMIDKIDAALPAVRDLTSSDHELDEIANEATETFKNLMDLGFNVDSRYSSEIFSVASGMLGHALTAKTTKMNKRLKIIDLQLKKAKLDLDRQRATSKTEEISAPVETAEGQILSRNDLLSRILGERNQEPK